MFKMLSGLAVHNNGSVDFLKECKFECLKANDRVVVFWSESKDMHCLQAIQFDEKNASRLLWEKRSKDGFCSHRSMQFVNANMFHIDGKVFCLKSGDELFVLPLYKDKKSSYLYCSGDGGYFACYSFSLKCENITKVYYSWLRFDCNFCVVGIYDNNIVSNIGIVNGVLYGVREDVVNGGRVSRYVVCADFGGLLDIWSFDCLEFFDESRFNNSCDVVHHGIGGGVFVEVNENILVLDSKTGELLHCWRLSGLSSVWSLLDKDISDGLGEVVRLDRVLVSNNSCLIRFGACDRHGNFKTFYIAAFDWRNGDVLWTRQFSNLYGQWLLADENTLVGVMDNYAMALNVQDGATVWRSAKPTRAGRYVSWVNGALCLWSDMTDRFEIYMPVPDDVEEADNTLTVEQLQQKLLDTLLPSVNGLSAELLELGILTIHRGSKISVQREVLRSASYEKLVETNRPAAISLMEQMLKYYPDMDDPEGYVHEALRMLGEILLSEKVVINFDAINKAVRAGCDGYLTSVLLELAELTQNKKRQALYKWALKQHPGSNYVMDAIDRLNGGEGY
jgi:outer membrane protein assembly factor BamB